MSRCPAARSSASREPGERRAAHVSETAKNTSQGARRSETRRTDRTARKKAAFLAALAEGYSVTGACKKARVGRSTVYEWRDADPEFARAWEDAWEAGGDWY